MNVTNLTNTTTANQIDRRHGYLLATSIIALCLLDLVLTAAIIAPCQPTRRRNILTDDCLLPLNTLLGAVVGWYISIMDPESNIDNPDAAPILVGLLWGVITGITYKVCLEYCKRRCAERNEYHRSEASTSLPSQDQPRTRIPAAAIAMTTQFTTSVNNAANLTARAGSSSNTRSSSNGSQRQQSRMPEVEANTASQPSIATTALAINIRPTSQ